MECEICPVCNKNERNKWIPEFNICNECLVESMRK